MKKIICYITLFFATNCFAEQLHNFDQIKSAVLEGKPIRIAVDYTNCNTVSGRMMVANSDAMYTPRAITINSKGEIVSSILFFTINDPHYPSMPVYQYGTYILSSDNTLLLTFTTLKATDYTQLGSNSSERCKIDDGVKVFC